MNKPIHPAVTEHVMEENARLREVLRCIADLPMDRCSTENDYRLSAAKAIALGALSQQAEPTDTFTAVDMATAAAQGFRDGQAAVEQAAAQDVREAVVVVGWLGGNGLHSEEKEATGAPFPLMTVAQHERIVASLTRPEQTEQQPIRMPTDELESVLAEVEGVRDLSDVAHGWYEATECIARLNAAPIAQTDPQPEQSGLVEAALRKAVAYLDENPFNEIASGSILHRVMGASLPAQGAST
ncbi:hypothetical protein [Stutzerimonas nitrititolerans]|uniref:hypothetical protein n=1 Tax=Stutzerimonas nitrititolerans TaxID=2482751 RepID=UPI00289CF935|nr:hypothetical protein [Stutzerimonas nitrititolerans]